MCAVSLSDWRCRAKRTRVWRQKWKLAARPSSFPRRPTFLKAASSYRERVTRRFTIQSQGGHGRVFRGRLPVRFAERRQKSHRGLDTLPGCLRLAYTTNCSILKLSYFQFVSNVLTGYQRNMRRNLHVVGGILEALLSCAYYSRPIVFLCFQFSCSVAWPYL